MRANSIFCKEGFYSGKVPFIQKVFFLIFFLVYFLETLPIQGQSHLSPEFERHNASLLFDSNSELDTSLNLVNSGQENSKYSSYDTLKQIKEVLSTGHWNNSMPSIRHFAFRHKDGWYAQSQSVGLEGFLWTKKELEGRFGEDAYIHHINDYFLYLDTLLEPVPWTQQLRTELTNFKNSDLNPKEKNARLNQILENYVNNLQKVLKSYDSAQWVRKARIYELFPRAYNTQGRRSSGGFKSPQDPSKTLFFRDFQVSDFDVIKRMGFDTIWPMGILPIGIRGQTGTGGGSPYSISDHSTVNPDLGTEEDFKNFVQKAHQSGLRVIVDFVVNHTSLDSKLLGENPDYFINYISNNGQCLKDGYFDYQYNGRQYCIHHGGFEYNGGISNWIDTAQLNYSNIYLRRRMIDIVKGWVTKFNVDGFRVDMAYLVLNNVFSRTWKKSMPNEEFYNQLIKEVKSIKPSTAFLAEAYAFQEDLSACGFDAIYSKYETARPEGQTGWYEALANANNYEQQSAINRQAFLAWQQGGSGSVAFIGNHDEVAPEKVFGRRLPAALMMTMLLPSSVMVYSGAEIGYDASIPTDHKPLPFSVPVQINWNGGNSWVKQVYQNVFAISQKIRRDLGDYEIEPIWPKDGGGWTGYIMKSKNNPQIKKAVIGNLTWNYTYVREFNLNENLAPGEYRIIDLP